MTLFAIAHRARSSPKCSVLLLVLLLSFFFLFFFKFARHIVSSIFLIECCNAMCLSEPHIRRVEDGGCSKYF